MLPPDIREKWFQWRNKVMQLKDFNDPRYSLNSLIEQRRELEIDTF